MMTMSPRAVSRSNSHLPSPPRRTLPRPPRWTNIKILIELEQKKQHLNIFSRKKCFYQPEKYPMLNVCSSIRKELSRSNSHLPASFSGLVCSLILMRMTIIMRMMMTMSWWWGYWRSSWWSSPSSSCDGCGQVGRAGAEDGKQQLGGGEEREYFHHQVFPSEMIWCDDLII